MSSGKGIFTVVVTDSVFEEIGVVEDVTAFAGGEISDGDRFSVLCAVDLAVFCLLYTSDAADE